MISKALNVLLLISIALTTGSCMFEADQACQETIEALRPQVGRLPEVKIDPCEKVTVTLDPTEFGVYELSGYFTSKELRYHFHGYAWRPIPGGLPGCAACDYDHDGWVTFVDYERITAPEE